MPGRKAGIPPSALEAGVSCRNVSYFTCVLSFLYNYCIGVLITIYGQEVEMAEVLDNKSALGKELSDAFAEWAHLNEYGGTDPFTTDGVLMNLIRKRIETAKKKCEAELEGDYPPEYRKKTPPAVSDDYMARADEIKKNARKSLKIYEQDPDYLWLAEQVKALPAFLTDEQIKDTRIRNVVDFPDALQFYIKTGSLVDMRRHEKAQKYVAKFSACRKRVEAALSGPSPTAGKKRKAENTDL